MVVIPFAMPVADRLALYTQLAREGQGIEFVRDLVARLRDERSPFVRALVVMRAVQAVRYYPDPPGPDRVFDPEWTAEHGGDCEDKAILFVASAIPCGVPATLVWLDPSRSDLPQAHIGTEAWWGSSFGWTWAEVSVAANPGEAPYTAAVRLGLLERIG